MAVDTPARYDFRVSRNVRPSEEWRFTMPDGTRKDLTGYAARMQWRAVRSDGTGPEGPALVDLNDTTEDAEGLRLYDDGHIIPIVEPATMGLLPAPAEAGDPLILWHDLVMTPPGGLQEVWFNGLVFIDGGITEPVDIRTTSEGDYRVTSGGDYRHFSE